MRLDWSCAQQLCRAAALYSRSAHLLRSSPCEVLLSFAQQSARQLHTVPALQEQFVTLNSIRDNPGATHYPKRVGRGTGSGLGKTSGRGHKGQKARSGRSPKLGFEGGQTPLRLRIGKRGFTNIFQKDLLVVNLDTVAQRIEQGRLRADTVITMRSLQDAGLIGKKIPSGVKLLGRGSEALQSPVHLQVTEASQSARSAVQAAGGSVTTVYYNQLGLRALLKPDWFAEKARQLPRPARPPAKVAVKFDQIGELPPSLEVAS